MKKPKVVVTRKWPRVVEEALAARYDTTFNHSDKPMSSEALGAALVNADALCPTVSDRLSAQVLGVDGIKSRIIGSFGVGFSHIDLETARRRELVVTNTPDVLTDCTADLAIMLMLMVARRAGEGERQVRNGQWTGWSPTHLLGSKFSSKSLGLVGFGRIARAVAERAYFGFGMKIFFTDPRSPPEDVTSKLHATDLKTLQNVVEEADIVSIHCPGGDATRHIVDGDTIARMKEAAILINTARGEVVDEAALIDALQAGSIAGAGFDVYEKEPAVPSALKSMENVVLLPHLGSASLETRVAMGMRVIDNLDAFFAERDPPDRVT